MIRLTLHRTETAVLPGHPLLAVVVIVGRGVEAQLVFGVVAARQVAQNGEPFHDGEATAVVVDDDGDAAVGAERREPRRLLRVLHDVDGLPRVLEPVCLLELLEQDRRLVAVGRPCDKKAGRRPWSVSFFSISHSLTHPYMTCIYIYTGV